MNLKSENRINARWKGTESWIYLSVWILVLFIYIIDLIQNHSKNVDPFAWGRIVRVGVVILPYIALFAVSNFVLIPRLLLRDKLKKYLISIALLILGIWTIQFFFWEEFHGVNPPPLPPGHKHHSWIPMPMVTSLICDVLIIGANLAVALIFQQYQDRLNRESMLKANAENELTYLKAQINPHFYMNMLNNIHGMIEIDAEKAQAMVIDMSRLMRYMLYDSSHPSIPLSQEVDFLQDYLRVMRNRFPEDKVVINSNFPSREESLCIEVPPLLTLVLAENAFKHGISYKTPSFVDIEMKIDNEDNRLIFRCVNSLRTSEVSPSRSGIGLTNLRQRLTLIYGEEATLTTNLWETTYEAILTIPIQAGKYK